MLFETGSIVPNMASSFTTPGNESELDAEEDGEARAPDLVDYCRVGFLV